MKKLILQRGITASEVWRVGLVRLTAGEEPSRVKFMEVTFHIPDDLASRVAAAGDLSRRALEAFALEELRAGRITEPQLREMLGLARIQMDGFLKSHGIF